MNGLTEESTNLDNNQRFETSYETPSKRSRSTSTQQISQLSSVETTNNENRSLNAMDVIVENLSHFWSKVTARFTPESRQEVTQEVSTIDRTYESMNQLSSEPNCMDITNASVLSKPNQTFGSNSSSNWSQPKPLERTRKRPFSAFQREEKRRYQDLLCFHLGSNYKFGLRSKKNVKKPEVIDLTLPMSQTNTFSFNNEFTKTSVSSHRSQQQQYTKEVLDSRERTNLCQRIKNAGIIGQPMVILNTTALTPFGVKTTPKLNYFSTPKTQSKGLPLNETYFRTNSLPESTQKFNDYVSKNTIFLQTDWIKDMKNSLIQSERKSDEKISKVEQLVNVCKIKRETDVEAISARLRKPITRTEICPFVPFIERQELDDIEESEEEDEELEPTDLPVLTPDMEREIDNALRPTPPKEVLVEGFSVEICRKDMETLKGLNWLNDEVINFYLSLVVERGKNDNFSNVYAFNTFFYKKLKDNGPKSLMRWTRKVDVFSYDFIFIPIHLGMHWCLAVIDFREKKIQYYDSMGGKNHECVEALKQYLRAESLDKKKNEFPMTDWTLEMVKDIPQQMNGSDCGMFSCKYAEYISRRAKINFSQAHMPYFRRRMVYEILNKQLL